MWPELNPVQSYPTWMTVQFLHSKTQQAEIIYLQINTDQKPDYITSAQTANVQRSCIHRFQKGYLDSKYFSTGHFSLM